MDNLKRILSLVKEGTKEKPVSRFYLTLQTGMSDRKIRDTVGMLRDRRIRVCGTSNETGYWIAQTEAEYREFRRNYISKALTIIKRVKAMDGWMDGQMEMIYELLR